MKKLHVNKEACIGCGACVAIDPVHFDLDDDGLSHVINNEDIESENAQNAISSCPTGAISCSCGCDGDCECGDNCECGDDCECKNCK